MSYEVLARKWRPPRFSDVVGQDTVTRTLANAIKSGRIAHAFLFSGVRGVGKTTTARILAKSLNCRQGPTTDPCDECDSCREIARSGSVDVLEIDAASNTGVDNIREIRDSVRYGTARDRFKIFIIDEVHMLSTAAFNALLKTLEEPPPHVKFILATTELHKIPITIRSRCQIFEFKPIPFGLILERLEMICREEGIEISEYALRWIAEAGRGSMRDAESTLDQVIALAGTQVADDDVRSILGVVDEQVLEDFSQALLEQNTPRLLELMELLSRSGIEAHGFCRKLIGHIRNLLVCRVAGWNESLIHVPESHREAVERYAKSFSEIDLIRFYDVLNQTEEELRQHPRPYTHLEITLVKLIELARLPALETVISRLQGGSAPPAGDSGRHSPQQGQSRLGFSGAPEAAPRASPERHSASRSPAESTAPQPAAEAPEESPARASGNGASLPAAATVEGLLRQLQQDHYTMIFQSLQHANRVKWEGSRLEVAFDDQERFHESIVSHPERLRALAEVCAKISGSEVEVIVQRDEESQVRSVRANPLEDPAVQTFMNAFPGKQIVEHHSEDDSR